MKNKVVHLFPSSADTTKDDMLKALRGIIDDVENDKIERFMFAAKRPGGEVVTGWAGCDILQRQELTTHLQVDICTDAATDAVLNILAGY